MGKHSIVTQAQGFVGTPVFKAVAGATVAGSFFGVGTTVAVAAPQADSSDVQAPKVVAATVDLAANLTDAESTAEAVAGDSQASSGWTFNTATVEIKEESRVADSRTGATARAAASDSFTYQPVSSNGELGERIAAIASQGVGRPYVWGGTSPAGWDCSGFVSWVYAQAGISLPRTTEAIRSVGTPVSASQAQPGDVMYWPGHVGIYMGGGMHVAAQTSDLGTRYAPVYGSPTYLRFG